MAFFIILAALLTVLVLLHEVVWLLRYRLESRRRGCGVPQRIERMFPLGIPRIVHMLKLAKKFKLLEVQTKTMLEDYKVSTILRQAPLQWQIFTIDPDNIKAVLATKFDDFSLGIRSRQLAPVFGYGIFTLSGEGWKHSRNMLRPQFARKQINRVDQVSEHAMTLINAIEQAQCGSKWIDIQHYFHLFTMDTATEFLFGKSTESLRSNGGSKIVLRSGEEMTAEDFVESYTFLNKYAFKRAIMSKLYWTQNSKEFREHRRRAQAFIDYYVDRALHATSFPEVGTVDEKDEVYVFSLEMAKTTRDPVVIRDQIFNILIAGRDTTASTMAFAMFFLAKYPAIFEKLREDIIANFGTEEHPEPVSFESLKKARYLQFFINEVLRLTPILPINFRQAERDTTLPTGGGPDGKMPVFVPKGATVSYSVYAMHRDPTLWGPDAAEFRPERWDGLKLQNLWAFLPFNGGPRICIGQQFALTEIALTLTRLLQHFSKIEQGPDFPEKPKFLHSLTVMNGPPGVPIRLRK